jgi:hypothetical protein
VSNTLTVKEASMPTAAVRAGLVVLGLVWALGAQTVLAGELGSYVTEGSKAAGLDACVEPTDYMRRNHMELIKHQRDETVHGGIRATTHNLAGCVDCHVSAGPDGEARPIQEEDQFCGACHAFAAVDMNCFGCHASVRRGGAVSEAAMAAHQAAGVVVTQTEADASGRGEGQ